MTQLLDPDTRSGDLRTAAAGLRWSGGLGRVGEPRSVGQVLRRGRVRGPIAMLGPAFIAAIAYVDPGNFSTNFTAGARYGYDLVWVVVAANIAAMPVQFLSAKIGVVTGRSMPEVCRERCPRVVTWLLWAQAELVAIATDLAEFVGAAIGLNLLFGVAPLPAGVVTAIAALALLALQAHGVRAFERAVCLLFFLLLAGFTYQIVHTGTDVGPAAAGLIPSMPGTGALYLSAGIIGATMMPHVVYLHSALTAQRVTCRTDTERRQCLRFERADVLLALGLAGVINLAMLLIAAHVFTGTAQPADTLDNIHQGLARAAGGGVALAFAGALLVSGISSSSVGTLAGQSVMSGFITRRISLYLRRAVTMAPALAVLCLHINTTAVLNFSQVVLSFGIPFALAPLILIGRRRDIMGAFTNPAWVTAALTSITAAVVTLNGALLYHQFLA